MLRHCVAFVFGMLIAIAPARAEDVSVFAAASLTDALEVIGQTYTAKTGNKVVGSYAASSTLAKQIEQGAPADVFASADLRWMNVLAEKGLIVSASRVELLGNSLVLVAPLDSPLDKITLDSKTDIAALTKGGRIATGNPDSVPVGVYFKQAMERSGQWALVAPKVAGVDSVRAALALVERGEVPLGVVYGSDAVVSKKVKVVGVFPATLHDPIVYPFALVTGRETRAAWEFINALKTPEAKEIFHRYGFVVR